MAKSGKSAKQPKRDKVWVCRGCCCGTRKKHPGIDHAALEKQARRGSKALGARYQVTDCLGPCGQGNIVVTRTAGRVRWWRKMNDVDTTQELLEHLREGGDLPAALERHQLPRKAGKKP